MPIKPELIPHKPREKGAAASHVDLMRRIRSLESKSGVVGRGATITGPTIQTADSGQRVYMQGPLGTNPGGVGVFCTDPSGNLAVSLQPGIGLFIETGTSTNSWNQVTWATAAVVDGFITVTRTAPGGHNSNDIYMEAKSPDAIHSARIDAKATDTGASPTRVDVTVDSSTATVLNNTGDSFFPRGIGQWGASPPGSQPAHPVTLGDVITILTNYGLCA